jgi:predicted DNA-binding ribbon-helix-helix protein
MCRIFAGQDPASYEGQTRSIRLNGHSTSIRLEAAFWAMLEEIAESQGMSVARFASTLHDEVLELHGEVSNFASLLRCTCLVYATELRERPACAGDVPPSRPPVSGAPRSVPALVAAE